MSKTLNIAVITDEKFSQDIHGRLFAISSYHLDKLAELFGESLSQITLYCRVIPEDSASRESARINLGDKGRIISLPLFDKYGWFKVIPQTCLQLWREFRDTDIVWLRMPFLYSILAFIVGKIQKKMIVAKVVGDVEKTLPFMFPGKISLLAAKIWKHATLFIMKNADLQVAVSEAMAEKYCPKTGYIVANRSRLIQAYYFYREQSNIHSPIRLLYVGRLSREKGLITLVEAVSLLVARGVDIKLFLVGKGDLEEYLKTRCKSLHITNNVEFLGQVPHGTPLFEIYRQADIFVLPSFTEGLPSVLLEAMANSVPVIATAVGGIPEVVRDGETGILVPPQDAEAISEAVIRLIESTDLRNKLIKNAYELALTNSFEKQTGKIVKSILERSDGIVEHVKNTTYN